MGGCLAILLLASAVSLFAWTGRTVSYTYRLTVEVQTPNGIRLGSAVHRIAAKPVLLKLVDGMKA